MRPATRPVRRRHVSLVLGRHELRNSRVGLVLSLLLLAAVTVWSYWPTMADLVRAWQSNDDYSAGQLVPLVALFLVWREREPLRQCPLAPCWLGGVTLFTLTAAFRTCGFLLVMRASPDRYALILAMTGLILLVAGWQVFRRVVWILLFLFLMFPLPGVVDNLIAPPLQTVATTGSVLLLEAVGIEVSQQGNIVMLGENTPMAVAEACSGLRMLMAFVIVAAFIAYMVRRPRWPKAVLLVSSIPVAVVCNIVRIFVTAVLMLHVSSEAGEKFFHDFAGLVMMPIAVLLLFAELSLMGRLVVPESEPAREVTIARTKPVARARKASRANLTDCV